MSGNKRFPTDTLTYLITAGEADASNFLAKKAEILETIRIAVDFNIKLIQIREKRLSAKLLFELAAEAAAITRESGTRLLVNDRADIALAAQADGVHLPANSLSADVVRRSFPHEFIIGVSTHSLAEAESAMELGADFVAFGSVFETPDKNDPTGLGALQQVCEKLENFPVIALGGIDETNYRSVLDCGASGFAAIRFLNDPANLRRLFEDIGDA